MRKYRSNGAERVSRDRPRQYEMSTHAAWYETSTTLQSQCTQPNRSEQRATQCKSCECDDVERRKHGKRCMTQRSTATYMRQRNTATWPAEPTHEPAEYRYTCFSGTPLHMSQRSTAAWPAERRYMTTVARSLNGGISWVCHASFFFNFPHVFLKFSTCRKLFSTRFLHVENCRKLFSTRFLHVEK